MLLKTCIDSFQCLVNRRKLNSILVTVQVNAAELVMELDMGAVVSIIGATTYTRLGSKTKAPPLSTHTQKQLQTYTGEVLEINKWTLNLSLLLARAQVYLEEIG